MSDLGVKKGKAVQMGFGKGVNLIDALPIGLIMYILALLPIPSIYTCRRVCRFFKTLISEEYCTRLCIDSPFTTIVYDNLSGVHLLQLANGYRKSYQSRFPRHTKVIGSCNGLLCLSVLANYYDVCCIPINSPAYHHSSKRFVQVCNPILGQYAILPRPELEYNMKDIYGFGFSSRTRSYKVLRILTRRDPPHQIYKKRSDAEIVTIGTDHHQWRSAGYLPYPSNQEMISATLEGAFHWLFDNELKNITSLYAFNIEEEEHYQIPIPSHIKNCNVMRVGVFRECLCVFDNSVPGEFSIWSMKKYRVMESWTLEFKFNTSIPGELDASALYPVAVLKNGSIFIKSANGNFYTYDQKNKIFAKFEIGNVRELGEFNGSIVHSSSFRQEEMLETGCLKLEESVEAMIRSARSYW